MGKVEFTGSEWQRPVRGLPVGQLDEKICSQIVRKIRQPWKNVLGGRHDLADK